MRRLDHTMIFVLIAGSYTPFGLLVLRGTVAAVILITAWFAAGVGAVFRLIWIDAPGWLIATVHVAIVWIAMLALPQLVDGFGIAAVDGVGARRPPLPHGRDHLRPEAIRPRSDGVRLPRAVHLLVIVAAALQYAVVAFWVL